MKYEVRIKVGYYTAFFDFEDINEASTFLATAVEKHVSTDDDRETVISMVALKEEES